MSSQERWDIVLYFPEGPLSLQGDLVCRGPVVRLGANPGPGGIRLDGYRGLDDRQAVITAYDGSTVSIAPVGNNQVRLAAHPNVEWDSIQPLRGPAYLTDGCAFHLGPPGRGVTAWFVECRRLGVWEQERILSDAADAKLGESPTHQPSEVRELQANRGIPGWFIGGMLGIAVVTAVAVIVPLVGAYQQEIALLGPIDRGEPVYEVVDQAIILDENLKEGFNQAWMDFIQKPNALQAGRPELVEMESWDMRLLDYTTRSAQQHLLAWSFWVRLEEVKDDWSYVLRQLREANLPDAFAAIPYTESRYIAEAQSPVCAKGWWQLMPEVAHRVNVEVRDCSFRGRRDVAWTPTQDAPPNGLFKNAAYMADEKCLIPAVRGCKVDQRVDLGVSTRGAIELLDEAWKDVYIATSGAAVQMVIASHNGGYDDSRFLGRKKVYNVLPAYQRHLEGSGYEYDPEFVGKAIRCGDNDYANNDSCGSPLHRHTQHYTYKILAQHFLAVCYYGANHADDPTFEPYRDYTRGDGYCTRIKVPTLEQVKEKM